MLSKIAERLSSAIGHFGAWCIFGLMIIGIVGVITRFAGVPLSGILSLSVFIFVAAVYVSLAYTQVRNNHVAVDLFISRLSSKHRLVMKSVTTFLSFVACFFLFWATWSYAWDSLIIGERMDGEPYYPIYPVKICIAIGVTIFFLQMIADFVKSVQSLRTKIVNPD